MKGIVGAVVAIAVMIALLHSGGHKKTDQPASSGNPQGAQFELIASQSSCQETPSQASINCSVAVKNRGDGAGLPTVYAIYEYTDSGSSGDASDNGECMTSDSIPAQEIGFVYFCHPYNALQHDLLRAAVSLQPDYKDAPYVQVYPPGAAWPPG